MECVAPRNFLIPILGGDLWSLPFRSCLTHRETEGGTDCVSGLVGTRAEGVNLLALSVMEPRLFFGLIAIQAALFRLLNG